jgi:hypothetical protein
MAHNTHAKHAAREEVARVLVHDQYSQVASNRPKYTNHFGRSDSTASFERQTSLPNNGRQSRFNSLEENDIVPVGTECPPNSTGMPEISYFLALLNFYHFSRSISLPDGLSPILELLERTRLHTKL